MALPSEEELAATIMANAMPGVAVTPNYKQFFEGIAKAVLDAIKEADVNPGTFSVVGPTGPLPITPGTKGKIS